MSTTIPDGLRLDGRAYIVAGAGGGGIGTAVCVALAQAGARVVAVDRTEIGRATAAEALEAATANAAGQGSGDRSPGGGHLVLDADLSDAGGVAAMVGRAAAEAGPVSGAVNVVGGMRRGHWDPLAGQDIASFEEVFALNVRPAALTASAVAREIIRTGGGGGIVTIASTAGLVSMPFGGAYAAAKAAVISLTRTMAAEWGRYGIRVNAVAPGTIRVQRIGRERYDREESEDVRRGIAEVVPLGRRGEAADVAGAVLFLLSDLAAYVSGHTLVVDGGALARPPFVDADGIPVAVTDPALRAHLLGDG